MARLISTEDEGNYPLPYPPKACAVSGRAEGEFIDFNTVIDRPEPTRLYLHRDVFETIARETLGMVSEGREKQLKEWLEHAQKELAELRETVDLAADLEDRRPDSVRRKEL